MKTRKNQGGFTLIETMLVIALVGFLGASAAVGLSTALEAASQGQSRGETSETLSLALSRMIQEISQLKDSESVVTAGAAEFRFSDIDDQDIRYHLVGNQLLRNNDVLARNVQSLTFGYWDSNSTSLSSPQVAPSETDLWRISIQLVGTKGGQTVNLRSQIHPRNLRRS